jgi:hypothetical protein
VHTVLASLRASALGIAAACAVATVFAILSGFALSEQRLAEVVRTAFTKDEFAYATRPHEDFFGECALLAMQHLRRKDIAPGAFDTKFLMRPGEHPCDSLRTMVLGSAEEKASLPAPVSYFNYPFGSRHLEAFALSVFDYASAARLYLILSYASLLLLLLIMILRAPATAVVLAPIPVALIGAFAVHRFGGNLAHAPGYFFGFVALAVFVGQRRFHSVPARFAFAGALGVLAAYFDLLVGVIVTLLALTILLNHFYYVATGRDAPGYAVKAASQACALFGIFLIAYVTVTLGRLGILHLMGVDVSAFTRGLAFRTGSDIGIPVTLAMTLDMLFAVRSQLTPGGAGATNWVFLGGLAGWIVVGLIGVAALLSQRSLRIPTLVDVSALAVASLGIFAWYWLFVAHTYVHAQFMVRLLALPLACGLAAALIAVRDARRDRLPSAVLLICVFAAVPLAALTLHKRWNLATAVEARFVDAVADRVSCGPLGLRADGRPDGVIEIRFQRTTPPLSYAGLRPDSPAYIQLVRFDPVSAYHTGPTHNIVGIASEAGGALLNTDKGAFVMAARAQRAYAHFCDESRDRRDRSYELKVDGVRVPIVPARN